MSLLVLPPRLQRSLQRCPNRGLRRGLLWGALLACIGPGLGALAAPALTSAPVASSFRASPVDESAPAASVVSSKARLGAPPLPEHTLLASAKITGPWRLDALLGMQSRRGSAVAGSGPLLRVHLARELGPRGQFGGLVGTALGMQSEGGRGVHYLQGMFALELGAWAAIKIHRRATLQLSLGGVGEFSLIHVSTYLLGTFSKLGTWRTRALAFAGLGLRAQLGGVAMIFAGQLALGRHQLRVALQAGVGLSF